MLASPQNRVFLGLVVRISLKNDWVISQTELRAVVVEKLEASSGKNNVGNTRHRASQALESYNLSTAFNEWIANNYAVELNVPLRLDPSNPWSTATLNRILQTCIVSDSRGINIHTFQTVESSSQICIVGLCAPGVTHSI